MHDTALATSTRDSGREGLLRNREPRNLDQQLEKYAILIQDESEHLLVRQKSASAASLTVAPIAVAEKRWDILGPSAVEQQGIPAFRAEWAELADA